MHDDWRLAQLSVTGDRQAAVRTAFDHSYAALEPNAARLFALLFHDLLRLYAAEHAAAAPDRATGLAATVRLVPGPGLAGGRTRLLNPGSGNDRGSGLNTRGRKADG